MTATEIKQFKVLLLGAVLAAIIATGWLVVQHIFFKSDIRHVVLISIDTCRADHLGCYGYSRKTTPNIDAIAEEGILFENCISPVPLTLPAHTSIMTGKIPPSHGVHDNGYVVDNNNLMLAELLKDNGFITGAVIGAFVMDSQFGLNQGFDYYNDDFLESRQISSFAYIERNAEEVTSFATSWLKENKKKKSFLFIHYFDPHGNYDPPDTYKDKFDNPYDGEIAYTDKCIGDVVSTLKKLGIYDSSLLIITADHGESLGEHRENTHGYFIYKSTVHVPLIIKYPGAPKNKRINNTVGLIDIFPTICNRLDIPVPKNIEGIDLENYYQKFQLPNEDRLIYSESLLPTKWQISPLFGLTDNNWKYIQAPKPELYDLRKDPYEKENLINKQAEHAQSMKKRLEQTFKDSRKIKIEKSIKKLNTETRKRLESLGYIDGKQVDDDFVFDKYNRDPKDLISLYLSYDNIRVYIEKALYQKAENICHQMLKQWPDIIHTYYFLARIEALKKNHKAAIQHMTLFLEQKEKELAESSELTRIKPEIFKSYNLIGLAFSKIGEYDKAIEYLNKALVYKPDMSEAVYNLGNVYLNMEKFEKAASYYKQALKLDPDSAKIHCNLGNALLNLSDPKNAFDHYYKALQCNPDKELQNTIYDCLAKTYFKQNNTDKALEYWAQMLNSDPNQTSVLNDMGVALLNNNRPDEAIEKWKSSLELEPMQHKVHKWMGSALMLQGNLEMALKHWEDSIKINPLQTDLLHKLGGIYYQLKKTDETLFFWNRALEINPDLPDVLNDFAWMLATNKNTKIGDPEKALKMAEHACELTDYSRANFLDTLSVAYAANGNFSDAIETAQKALDIAEKENMLQMADEIKGHIDLYKTQSPLP